VRSAGLIHRANNASLLNAHDMGIDLRGGDIFMPHHLLDIADIRACAQEVGSKSVPKGMATRLLIYACKLQRRFNGTLDLSLALMMTPNCQ